jgi:AbiU2
MTPVERMGGDTPSIDELLGRTQVVPPAADSRLDEWCAWVDDIDKDLTDVAIARYVWRTINRIVADHPAIPPSFLFDVQARNYAAAQTIAVRRHVDRDPRSVTMIRLLSAIRDSPEVLSRQRLVSRYPWGIQHLGDRQFDDWAGSDATHVDLAMVTTDIDKLIASTESIQHYVNKHIAHLDEKRVSAAVPTFDDLDNAIDTLFELFRKYALMLTGHDRAVMEPVPQYDWLAPLRMPWITE